MEGEEGGGGAITLELARRSLELEAIDAAYQEHGHSEDYQAMTEEDIRFWNDFLDRWEKEHPLEPREEGGGGEIPESTLKTNVN